MTALFQYPWFLCALLFSVFVALALFPIQNKLLADLALWCPAGQIKVYSLKQFLKLNFLLILGLSFLGFACSGPLLSITKFNPSLRIGTIVIALKANEKTLPGSIDLQSILLSQIQNESSRNPQNRIGLIPWSNESDLYCPLTLDPEFFKFVAASLKRPEVKFAPVKSQALSLKQALQNSLQTFNSQTLCSKSLILIVPDISISPAEILLGFSEVAIPSDINVNIVFTDLLVVPSSLQSFCEQHGGKVIALGAKVFPEGQVIKMLRNEKSTLQYSAEFLLLPKSTPEWFALPGLLLLVASLIVPPLGRQVSDQLGVE